jgi:hypothetical protein
MGADIVQQVLRRGGEDDLDVGRAGWVGVDRRVHRRCHVFHMLGDISGDVGTLSYREQAYAVLPAGELSRLPCGRGEGIDELVERPARLRCRHGGTFRRYRRDLSH